MHLGAVPIRAAEPGTVGVQPQAGNTRTTNSDPSPEPRTPARANAGVLDGIVAVTDERGRTVYVNAPPTKPAKSSSPEPLHPHTPNQRIPDSQPRQTSVLVDWNSSQNHRQTGPLPTARTVKAARNAASDVAGVLAQQPSSTRSSPAPNAPSKTAATPSFSMVGWKEIDAAIEQAAARHNIDPNLVRAIIKVESNFNPWAVSRKGAMGLMQLMPETARQLNVTHPFDPQENVDAGVRHLRRLLDNYGGDVRLSLAAYNAGETAVMQHAGIPNFAETRNYVKQITSRYWGGVSPLGSTTTLRVFRATNGILTIRSD